MEKEFNNTEEIEKYLLNELSEKELEEFNIKLQADAALQQEVALQRRVIQSIEIAEFKNLMEQFHQGIQAEEKQAPGSAVQSTATGAPVVQLNRNTWMYYAIAASVLLLLVAGLVFYRNTVSQTLEVADIKYIVKAGEQALGVAGTQSVSTITVKIYPPEANRSFHYRFDDTLRLYGKFRSQDLILLYNEPREEYRLQDQQHVYVLERYQETAPLMPTPK
jgi:anti-sigma factor RsiW